MGKDTTKASDHPTTNALAAVDNDDSVDTGGVYIGISATNIKLEEELEIGDVGVLMLKYEVTGDGRKKMADGELRDRRTLKALSVWKPGSRPASTDPNQGELYETNPVDGAPASDAPAFSSADPDADPDHVETNADDEEGDD